MMKNQSNVSVQTSIRKRIIIANVRNLGLYLIEMLQLQKKRSHCKDDICYKTVANSFFLKHKYINWKFIWWIFGFLNPYKWYGCNASAKKEMLWTLKIIGDISGSLIKKAVAACVNKLAQFQFRMTVLKGRPLSFSVLFPFFI